MASAAIATWLAAHQPEATNVVVTPIFTTRQAASC